MKALILAAGYATRLYPLTKEYPKPLLKVANKPLIDYIIDKITKISACDQIIVITNSKFFAKFKSWKSRVKVSKPVTIVDDLTKCIEDRRGAIGDMYFAIKKLSLNDDLLVIGGDNLFDGSISEMISFAKCKGMHAVIGVYDLKNKKEAGKYGVVKLNAENRIVDFKEKPKKAVSSKVAMCLYYFPKEKLRLVKEYFKNKSHKHDAAGFYIDWLRRRDKTYGYVFDGRWFDIGDFKFYNRAKKSFLK